ncbi:unnamed protein product [Haemonchus placei]|uniref:Uncharacterized protein n=1 Tax=Haemonchus placei TaxID=6290 RepID=A0A3P7TJ72_HAEPC|nr:unnamed protein product [Haemonchus placei]
MRPPFQMFMEEISISSLIRITNKHAMFGLETIFPCDKSCIFNSSS